MFILFCLFLCVLWILSIIFNAESAIALTPVQADFPGFLLSALFVISLVLLLVWMMHKRAHISPLVLSMIAFVFSVDLFVILVFHPQVDGVVHVLLGILPILGAVLPLYGFTFFLSGIVNTVVLPWFAFSFMLALSICSFVIYLRNRNR